MADEKKKFLIRPAMMVRYPDGRLLGQAQRYVGGGCAVTLYAEEPCKGTPEFMLKPVRMSIKAGTGDWITDTVIVTDQDVELGVYTVEECSVRQLDGKPVFRRPDPLRCVCPDSPCPRHTGAYRSQAAKPFGKVS